MPVWFLLLNGKTGQFDCSIKVSFLGRLYSWIAETIGRWLGRLRSWLFAGHLRLASLQPWVWRLARNQFKQYFTMNL